MSGAEPRPPVLSRRLLEWAARRLGTPELADDAADLFVERSRRDGDGAARHWYRRQAFATLRPLLLSRLRVPRATPRSSWRALSRRPASRVSVLDFKLGLRMLLRYPGLTMVAGTAMAFAIGVGAGTFEFLRDAMYPTLPLADGDRIVRLHEADRRSGDRTGVSPDAFLAWRESLQSVRELGAFQGVARNLWLDEEAVVPVDGVAVSPSAFAVAGVHPLFGRPLVEGDEAPAAPPVVVLGFDLWRSRFASDPGVIGRAVRLGDVRTTVVGVMPEGYGFPAPADLYVPLRLDGLRTGAGPVDGLPGPATLTGFGRLAPDATVEEARTELATVAAGAATDSPDEREHLVPVVERFAYPLITTTGILTNLVFAATAFFLIMLMVVVCANVALLLFARAATREGELAVRTALGASRGRIVAQLFIEALVLAAVATLAGLLAASAGLKWAIGLANASPGGGFPFWVGDTLSPATVAWAILLAILGAAIAGVSPALQVTGRGLNANFQRGAGRGTGVRLGRLWTVVVVTQVALTVIFVPVVLATGAAYLKVRTAERGVVAEEYLVTRLEAGADARGFEDAHRRLRARLAAEPWVRGVAVADGVWPGWRDWPLEVEGLPLAEDPVLRPRSQHLAVGPGFFDVMGARLIAGRPLTTADVDARPRVVVVDESFVREVLGGQNAVGRRIRIPGMRDPGEAPPAQRAVGADAVEAWHEIVGVVGDLGLNPHADLPGRAVIYRPLVTEAATRLALALRVSGEPGASASRLRVLALQVDPTMRLQEPRSLDYLMARPVVEYGAWARVIATAGALALLLTLAGIYAVMAFTVARRTREIGVRVALGADRRRVTMAVFSRAIAHVGYGVLAGGMVIPLLMLAVTRVVDEPGALWPPLPVIAGILALYLAVMMGACMLACVVPLRRALGVEPIEALAADA